MKKILITGAGGFLGRYLIEACFHKEFEIIAISSQKESLYKQFSGTDILVVDKLEALSTDWSKIDVLINCAFPRNVDGEKIADSGSRETHIHGNIGVTTSQQMLEAEIAIAEKINMYDYITRDFKMHFCVLVY